MNVKNFLFLILFNPDAAIKQFKRNLQQVQMSDLHHRRKDAYDDDVRTEPALVTDVHSLDDGVSQQFHEVLGGFVFGIKVLLQFRGFIVRSNDDAKRSQCTFVFVAILSELQS